MYHECNDCSILFNKPKLRFDDSGELKLPTISSLCPGCNSINISTKSMKELKIIIFDDKVDRIKLEATLKSISCKHNVTFTNTKSTNIVKTNNGYIMIFRISDFNKIEAYDIGRGIKQFITDTTYQKEKVVYNFSYEIKDEKSFRITTTERFSDQVLLLISGLRSRANKILVQDDRIDVPGDQYPIYIYRK